MPVERLYTPAAEAEWVHVFEPRVFADGDPNKPAAWSLNLLFPDNDSFIKEIEGKVIALHSNKKGIKFPFAPHSSKEGMTALKFKALQLQRRDGSFVDPPRVVDAKKNKWSSGAIGNGSILRVCYFIRPYDNAGNIGVTLIPTAIQVLQWVPMSDGSEGFEEDESGYAQPASDEEDGGW